MASAGTAMAHSTIGRVELTAWPPNCAQRRQHLRRTSCPSRERKRVNSEAVMTGAGTARSIASCSVQRPSPESST